VAEFFNATVTEWEQFPAARVKILKADLPAEWRLLKLYRTQPAVLKLHVQHHHPSKLSAKLKPSWFFSLAISGNKRYV